MLGEPLPNEEKQQNIDFDTMDEFDFVFDIALAPEFKAEVSDKDKVDYYTIEVSDEMIDNQMCIRDSYKRYRKPGLEYILFDSEEPERTGSGNQ